MITNYDGHSKKSGIYKIINVVNQKLYIGSAKEFKSRYTNHVWSLRKGTHHNKYLQSDFLQYGEVAFEFHVLEVVDDSHMNRLLVEQTYIDKYFDKQNMCYNVSPKINNWKLFGKLACKKHMSESAKLRWTRDRQKLCTARQQEKYRDTLSKSKSTKLWQFIDPDGNAVEFYNLQKFCIENNLTRKHMRRLHCGELAQYKGWTIVGTNKHEAILDSKKRITNSNMNRMKTYALTRADGTVATIVGLKKFCRDNGMHSAPLLSLIKGEVKSCYGFIAMSEVQV